LYCQRLCSATATAATSTASRDQAHYSKNRQYFEQARGHRDSPVRDLQPCAASGHHQGRWHHHPPHSPDALALKALTLAIPPLLPISPRRTHVKGHGGLTNALPEVQHHLVANVFFLRWHRWVLRPAVKRLNGIRVN